jgi:non-ribosomal peptide synthetase-like protein
VAFGRTSVGRRSFIGNAALVPAGASLGAGSLVGVQTTPPPDGVPDETSWLGSPPIFLPRRQRAEGFGDDVTYSPPRRRVLERLLIEYFRVTLPATVLSAMGIGVLVGEDRLSVDMPPLITVVLLPALLLLGGLAAVVVVAALKWLIVGRYRPRSEGLWSRFVRRTELVTALYESAAVPALLILLTGTPLLGPLLRLFGARIGRRTFLDTTRLTEFDLVRVGDDAAVGTNSSLQTHLFEDRVMKMSIVTVASRASVGPRSIVLYDAEVGDRSRLDALSLVMKGEQLPPGTGWRGIPCRPAPVTARP